MFDRISITCFASSYALTLALEVSRLFFRIPVRLVLIFAMAIAGLVAHTIYLIGLAGTEVMETSIAVPLSNWHDWYVLAAWLMTAAYLGLLARRPENAVGIFLLPLILLLVALGWFNLGAASFPRGQAVSTWQIIHGMSLLMGTVAVTLGFAAGIMYLVQAHRLKLKRPTRPGFRLPSLEWLQRFNRETFGISTLLLGLGLISGLVLTFAKRQATDWRDPVIISSAILFAWMLGATLFELYYKPAQQGKKIAYLTLASFIFLALVLWFVIQDQHGRSVPVTQVRSGPEVGEHGEAQPTRGPVR